MNTVRSIVTIIVLVLSAFSMTGYRCIENASATDVLYEVDMPSGTWDIADEVANDWEACYANGNMGWTTGDHAFMSDNYYSQWIATGYFVNPIYDADWPAQTLPANNVSIWDVWIKAQVAVRDSGDQKTVNFSYATNATYAEVQAGTAIWDADFEIELNYLAWGYYAVEFNVTTYEAWTPSMLKSNETWVRLWSDEIDSASNPLLIKYLGFYYRWYYNGTLPEGGFDDGEGMFGLGSDVSMNSIFGIIGFGGMVAVPPVAVWMWRREGGSRLSAFVTALTAFMFCFTLFLGSMG